VTLLQKKYFLCQNVKLHEQMQLKERKRSGFLSFDLKKYRKIPVAAIEMPNHL